MVHSALAECIAAALVPDGDLDGAKYTIPDPEVDSGSDNSDDDSGSDSDEPSAKPKAKRPTKRRRKMLTSTAVVPDSPPAMPTDPPRTFSQTPTEDYDH
jgi:hypothetical protein